MSYKKQCERTDKHGRHEWSEPVGRDDRIAHQCPGNRNE